MLPKGHTHSYTLTSKTNVDLLFDKTLKTGEFLLFNCCKLLCSSRVLRVANLQKPKWGQSEVYHQGTVLSPPMKSCLPFSLSYWWPSVLD